MRKPVAEIPTVLIRSCDKLTCCLHRHSQVSIDDDDDDGGGGGGGDDGEDEKDEKDEDPYGHQMPFFL